MGLGEKKRIHKNSIQENRNKDKKTLKGQRPAWGQESWQVNSARRVLSVKGGGELRLLKEEGLGGAKTDDNNKSFPSPLLTTYNMIPTWLT